MALYVENLVKNLVKGREVQLSLLSNRMQILLPAEKARHANCRKLSACFAFILLVPSFPKHLLVICHSVLQLDPVQHLCAAGLWAEGPLPGPKEYHCWLQVAENKWGIHLFSLTYTQWT